MRSSAHRQERVSIAVGVCDGGGGASPAKSFTDHGRQTGGLGSAQDLLRLLGPAHWDKQMCIRPCAPTRVRLTDTSGGGLKKSLERQVHRRTQRGSSSHRSNHPLFRISAPPPQPHFLPAAPHSCNRYASGPSGVPLGFQTPPFLSEPTVE